jgi:hypothetical protein
MSGDERRARRDERRATRVANRRSTGRQQARADRQLARQEARAGNVAARQDTRQIAYAEGQNPNQFVSDLAAAGGGVAESFFENRANVLGAQNPLEEGQSANYGGIPNRDWEVNANLNQGNSTMLYVAGAGLLIYMLTKK